MERVKDILDDLEFEVDESTYLHCFAIVTDEDNYRTVVVGDYYKIGEALYCAMCNDKELLATCSDSVKSALDTVEKAEE